MPTKGEEVALISRDKKIRPTLFRQGDNEIIPWIPGDIEFR